jgi:hypothetical protein
MQTGPGAFGLADDETRAEPGGHGDGHLRRRSSKLSPSRCPDPRYLAYAMPFMTTSSRCPRSRRARMRAHEASLRAAQTA